MLVECLPVNPSLPFCAKFVFFFSFQSAKIKLNVWPVKMEAPTALKGEYYYYFAIANIAKKASYAHLALAQEMFAFRIRISRDEMGNKTIISFPFSN